MKLGHPGHSRRLAVLGLASAIALGPSAIPATAKTPPRIPDVAMTPRQTPFVPFVPVPYPNISAIPTTKSSDKVSRGGQDDYIVFTMKNVLISN